MTLRDDSRWPSQEEAGPDARLLLLQAADQPDWHHRSACKGGDNDLFFPIGEGHAAKAQTREAKSYCRRCPVVDQCLQYALDEGIPDGIWGGLTEDERQGART